MRKGLGKGLGMGYKNIAPMDSHIHSLSAKGCKTRLNALGQVYKVKETGEGILRPNEDIPDWYFPNWYNKEHFESFMNRKLTAKQFKYLKDEMEDDLADPVSNEVGDYLRDYGEEILNEMKGEKLDAKSTMVKGQHYKEIETLGDLQGIDLSKARQILKDMGAEFEPVPNVDMGNLNFKTINIDYTQDIDYEVKHPDGSMSFSIMGVNPNQKIKLPKGDKLVIKAMTREESLKRYAKSLKDEWKDLSDKDLQERTFLGGKISARRDDELLRRGVTKK